jgi:hypothetical protein
LSAEPTALEPEQILVFEIAGELADFRDAVDRISGLEWLADQLELELTEADDEFARVDDEGRRKAYRRELFVLATDTRAWRELLRLWELYREGHDLGHGFATIRRLFDRLIELREWDDRDRLSRAGAASAWQRDLVGLSDEPIPFEIELWLRRDVQRRERTLDELRAELAAVAGHIDQETILEDIHYHGVLGTAPAGLLLEAAERNEVRWLSTQGVRLFHPIGQAVAPSPPDREIDLELTPEGEPPAREEIRLAILDGLPVVNHEALRNRVVIDDPDDWGSEIPVADRFHGTAMASLATRGDLAGNEEPLGERVYLRPILRPDAPPWVTERIERVPFDRLLVDFVHEVVRDMLADPDPAAPNVRVIGLSVGDSAQQFDRFISPWARLLDWLSFQHRVLFLVSAGNHADPISITDDVDIRDLTELEQEVLDSRRRNALSRRLLSPAESINALTVGAAHADGSDHLVDDDRLEAVSRDDLPSVINPIASGVRRSIKPDVLLPGGRQLLRAEPDRGDGQIELSVASTTRPPGLRVATPDRTGRLDATAFMCGTSAANALGLRAAGRLLGVLDQLRELWGDRAPAAELDPVVIKALLVHTARWGHARDVIHAMLGDAGESGGREAIARFLGYGAAQAEWTVVCDDHRVTFLHAGQINDDEAHEFALPLPHSLAGSTVQRRLTATLAWFTPINPLHRHYRRAALALELPAGRDRVFGTRTEASRYAAGRGTVQHEHLVSERAVPFSEGESETLLVSCRADAGELADEIPYAIVGTVDVPETSRLPIYEQIRDRLIARVPVRP